MVVTCSYLPDELWEYIIKLVNGGNPALKSLSLVSKPFLSITNCLLFSATISNETGPFLLPRFPNLTSLNLTDFNRKANFNALLTKISTFPLNLKSLTLSNSYTVPTDGLLALSKKMKNLRSLICYNITGIHRYDLLVIANCLPSLEELVLIEEEERSCSYYNTASARNFDFVVDDHNQFLALPKLRKISLYGIFVDHRFINYLRNEGGPHTWRRLQEYL